MPYRRYSFKPLNCRRVWAKLRQALGAKTEIVLSAKGNRRVLRELLRQLLPELGQGPTRC